MALTHEVEISTPIGLNVRIAPHRWDLIISVKHPVMAGLENELTATLQDPLEIRRSRKDEKVILFYRPIKKRRWICAVVKRENGSGFLITAYPTSAIKEGTHLWPM
jgi:hypothetical protein